MLVSAWGTARSLAMMHVIQTKQEHTVAIRLNIELGASLTCGTAGDAWSGMKPARKVSSIKTEKHLGPAGHVCMCSVLCHVAAVVPYTGFTVTWNQSGTQAELRNSISKPASQNGRIPFPCSRQVNFSLCLLAFRSLCILLWGSLKVTKTQACC